MSNKLDQPRNIIFPLQHFGKQKRALIRNGLVSLNSCTIEKTLIL